MTRANTTLVLVTAAIVVLLTRGSIGQRGRQEGGGAPGSGRTFVPVTDSTLESPNPGDWLMWRRTLNGWGYSPLDQVNTQNVNRLKLVWARELAAGFQEDTPLVYGGTMFLGTPPDIIQAIDAATGDLLWEYDRPAPDDLGKYLRNAPLKKRNIAIYGDNIIASSVNNFVYAVDARTGKLTWEAQVQDYRKLPGSQTSGPITARGKVFSGRACDSSVSGEACVIVAHDAKTGQEIWRFHTIPKPGEPGDETWGGVPYERRRHVGSWMPPSYDPELNLLYAGTSVTSPAPKFMLAGNDKTYLYHNSTLAIDAIPAS